MREGVAIGAIQLRRTEAQPFTERQVALLQTFADQAVIAIENVRLFTELEARNGELARPSSSRRRPARSCSVISRSPTDLQPVFDTIDRERGRGCASADRGFIFRFDGEVLHLVRAPRLDPGGLEARRAASRSRRTRERRRAGPSCERPCRAHPRRSGGSRVHAARIARLRTAVRTMLAVPMLREGEPIGAIIVRRDRGPALHRQADRAAPDLRRPGRHRHRERAAVHRAAGHERRPHRGAGAADGDQRDPAGDRQLADRPPAGAGRHRRERGAAVRRPTMRCIVLGRGRASRRLAAGTTARWRERPGRHVPAHRADSVTRPGDARPAADPRARSRDAEKPSSRQGRALATGAWASGRRWRRRCCAKGVADRRHRRSAGRGPALHATSRSRCSRPSPTRP